MYSILLLFRCFCVIIIFFFFFFFSSRRRHTRSLSDWSSDVCSSDLGGGRRTGHAAGRQSHTAGAAGRNPPARGAGRRGRRTRDTGAAPGGDQTSPPRSAGG